MKRITLAILAALTAMFALSACDKTDTSTRSDQQRVNQVVRSRGHAYIPSHNVEFNNYNRAQRLYDTPDTIIWCSTTWGNPSAPIVTVPIAGKLTSSTVSYFPSTKIDNSGDDSYTPEQRSVDGMYHGTPPPYRYGFTPGGQYVDFFNMPTVCTTALTKFQRQQTKLAITVDPASAAAQRTAENALARGDKAAAQAALESLGG